ncbi:hypothetical protein K443DRAFT_127718 [Laccaria amethystina LaAM-08-1]|uniref:Leucine carboxyl methyltransferase 1 n=1 Tax=Laccaria amethystina LaAM-08-1 TaxID=1095629 RepID=A0A0C9YFQ2_9AGAR|nr:hypothetical protein K443DRAFT_127718 [Laccaria amethystina LaAM-08-1]
MDPDASIRSTDNDAAVARLSAVQKRYLDDPFIKHLVPRAHLQPLRPPLINIGTFVRSYAIDDLTTQWLEESGKLNQPCQIVSLGSGSDTRFWRIATGPLKENLATYVEIDFPEITTKKAMAIRKSRELSSVLGTPADVTLSQGSTALHAPKYHLLPNDLRLPPAETMEHLFTTLSPSTETPILSSSLPTLLIFECVLAYISPEISSRLLEWFVAQFSKSSAPSGGVLGCVVYEMFGLADTFGRVMVNNLKTRNISIPGAEPFLTLDSLSQRFVSSGFTAAHALTLREIRKTYVDRAELERISTLELLDEMEELDLVLDHYAISWGLFLSNPPHGSSWPHWGLKKRQK